MAESQEMIDAALIETAMTLGDLVDRVKALPGDALLADVVEWIEPFDAETTQVVLAAAVVFIAKMDRRACCAG